MITNIVEDRDGMHIIEFYKFADGGKYYNRTNQRKLGMEELILNSSTEGSTKQFRITVDDSGTLTATEIT